MKIERVSMVSGETNTLEIAVTPEQLAAYEAGALLQDAFPQLDKAEREFIKSGITPEEWRELVVGEQPPIDDRTDDEKLLDEATEAALNAGCRVIQEALGIASGDFASMYFGGENPEITRTFADYLHAERVYAETRARHETAANDPEGGGS